MYCSECRRPCDSVDRDYGYGPYEYWGAKGCHTNWQTVSRCCEGDVLTKEQLEDLEEVEDGTSTRD